jgi:biotin carboxylase
MTNRHVVFVDSTLAGLSAFKTAKENGCRVTFVEPLDASFLPISTSDRSRVAPHLEYVDEHIKLPTVSGTDLIDELRRLARDNPVHGVITTSEAAILSVAQAAEELKLPAPSLTSLQNAVFKDRCRTVLTKEGLKSPRFEVQSEAELLSMKPRTVPVPLVVKPTRGFGKQFSAVCRTEREFAQFVSTLAEARTQTDPMINLIVNNDYLLEEYVTGSLHSTEVIVREGEVQFFATTTRYRAQHNDLLETGYSMPTGLTADKRSKLEQYVRDVFRAVGIRFGLYHVETIYAHDGPCLVEINGRMMGGVGPQVYQAVSGLDAFDLLLRLYLGERVHIDPHAIRGAATVLLVGAQEISTVSKDFSQVGLDLLLRSFDITFCTLKLHPGMPVRRFEGNVSVLGHVIVPGSDSHSSARRGQEFLKELENLLGFEVAKYSYDSSW